MHANKKANIDIEVSFSLKKIKERIKLIIGYEPNIKPVRAAPIFLCEYIIKTRLPP